MLRHVRSLSIDEPPCLTQCFLTKSIIQPRHWLARARARADTGLKLQQINHGSLTQEEEEEVASWGGISEEQTISADNRHGAS